MICFDMRQNIKHSILEVGGVSCFGVLCLQRKFGYAVQMHSSILWISGVSSHCRGLQELSIGHPLADRLVHVFPLPHLCGYV